MTIFEKIEKAKRLYEQHGKGLICDSSLMTMLDKYKNEILNSKKMMVELDIVKDCAFCDANTPGGSCCGAGIEDWYDEILLLINLLMGCKIPEQRRSEKDCLFLGEKGCLLLARNYFCINYLCSRIWKRLGSKKLAKMQAQSGKEIDLSWKIMEIINRALKDGIH